MVDQPRTRWRPRHWADYVIAGADRAARRARLAEAPAEWQEMIEHDVRDAWRRRAMVVCARRGRR